jgi:hypothetical protein
MPRFRVEARDLQAGDVLVPTGNIVQRRPESGVRTPANKVKVFLTKPDGTPLPMRTWGRYTTITITRKDDDQ